MKPSIQFVRRKDGVKLAYSIFGKGPPLVYPAPWITNLSFNLEDPLSYEFWEKIARNATVVLYDKHGCGQSDRDRMEFTLESEFLDLETVINHLRLEKFILFGISAAGPLCVMYAARYPEKVTHLILYGTFVSGKDVANKEVRSALIALIRSAWGLGSKTLMDVFIPRATKEVREIYAKFQRESCSPEIAAKLLELDLEYDVTDLLQRITIPTLILHRKGDRTSPVSQGRQLALGIPNARFKVLKGDIHIPWLGDTNQIIEEILEFIGIRETTAHVDKTAIFPAEESETVEQATIVFTDIVSSTDLVTQVGDAAARDLFLKHDEIVRDQLRKCGGKELQNLGDGFMLAFASASAAIKCACKIQQQISEALPSIQVRIGINTGEVVRREDKHPFGQTVVIASRIVSKCKGGQILISDIAKQLAAGSKLSFVERGRFKPKGFDDSIKLFEIVWSE
jgi:class 3 adenylate cyclase/pimeloyl-ACP methyl ester carboxylesterase